MISLPDYAPLVDLGSIIEPFDVALREKTNYAVMLRTVSTLFTGNTIELWLENQTKGNIGKKSLAIARLSPEFEQVSYPMTITLLIDANMLPFDDAEFLDEGVWAMDGDSPITVAFNPAELEDAINDIFQTDWVTIAVCELMSGGEQ